VNAAAGLAGGEPAEVRFRNGGRALLVQESGADPGELLAALGLQPVAGSPGVIVVCGGADDLRGSALDRAEALLGPSVSAASQLTGAAVLDGGTSSGVMAIIGAARAKRPAKMPVLVGVAPGGLVSYPGSPVRDRVALEENHSHFVLAASAEWGGETGLLMNLASARAGDSRVVVVLAGGGPVSTSEALESVRRRWPVFVLTGTGGTADDILRLWDAHRVRHLRRGGRMLPARFRYRRQPAVASIPDADLREIISEGDIRPVSAADPGQFARRLAWELQDEPVLKAAWQQFATYDRLARRLRAAFSRLQALILLLGVLATLLALIQASIGSPVLHWVVVTTPILAAVLMAVMGRRAVGQRWVMLRAAAEAIRAEIYRYRTLVAGRTSQKPAEYADRQQELAALLDAIDTRLMQTEASSGPLTPYAGPLPPPMYGAARDDDGLSPMDAERYLATRIADELAYFHGRVRTLNRRRDALQVLAVLAGATGAILAAAGLGVWIGLTSGASAAALAYLGYLQIDNTVVTYNQTAARLAGLEREWRARGPAQQRSEAALTDLVTRGETVLTSELAGWVLQMSDTLHDVNNRQAATANYILQGSNSDASGSLPDGTAQ